MATMNCSHGSSGDDSLAGAVYVNCQLEEGGGGWPLDNAIIDVPIGFQLQLLSSEET
jgi:hypothetical protein